jgi:hypothetical protein
MILEVTNRTFGRVSSDEDSATNDSSDEKYYEEYNDEMPDDDRDKAN